MASPCRQRLMSVCANTASAAHCRLGIQEWRQLLATAHSDIELITYSGFANLTDAEPNHSGWILHHRDVHTIWATVVWHCELLFTKGYILAFALIASEAEALALLSIRHTVEMIMERTVGNKCSIFSFG
jgi:hypothetical protein